MNIIKNQLSCWGAHTGMAERGCLDIPYTDGSTPREIIREHYHVQF
jgi:hypothetical protein